MVQQASGEFEICKERTLLVSGRVRIPTNIREEYVRNFPTPDGSGNLSLAGEEVYGELEQRGYQYRGLFRGILEAKLMRQGEKHVSCENKIPSSTLSLRLFNQDTCKSFFFCPGNFHHDISLKLCILSHGILLRNEMFSHISRMRLCV